MFSLLVHYSMSYPNFQSASLAVILRSYHSLPFTYKQRLVLNPVTKPTAIQDIDMIKYSGHDNALAQRLWYSSCLLQTYNAYVINE